MKSVFPTAARLCATLLACLPLVGCGLDYEAIAKLRLRFAELGQGAIVFVAIEEPWTQTYIDGMKLAVSEVNLQRGKLLGRSLHLDVRAGGQTFEDSRFSVLKIAVDPSVAAVLGHWRPNVAIPASVIYEAANILFVPPLATAKALTGHDFKFVFRIVPGNKTMAGQMASVAQLLGYRTVVLLYAQDDYSRELAFMFEDAAVSRGLDFVQRRSFAAGEEDYRSLIAQFSNNPPDLIFLSAEGETGGRMARQLREMGVTAPIMGGETLNARAYVEAAGRAADNTVVPSVYQERAETPENRRFVERYTQRFGLPPDQNAALGYDSVHLLADAIAQAKSVAPQSISAALHYRPLSAGVTGMHVFDAQGEAVGKKYVFQVWRGDRWHFLPALHLPYLLERLDRHLAAQTDRPSPPRKFSTAFAPTQHLDDLRLAQLDLAHEIVGFEKLGAVYQAQESERYRQIAGLGAERRFEVEGCAVETGRGDAEARLIECIGRLAIVSDTLLLVGFAEFDRAQLERALRPLQVYKVPVLALQGDVAQELGAEIRVGRFGDKTDLQTARYAESMDGLVGGAQMRELSAELENLPAMTVDMNALKDYGRLQSGLLGKFMPDLRQEWQTNKR